MPQRDIIVIGTSAGGVEALKELFRNLPEDLNASVFVVCHLSEYSPGVLPNIISWAGKLPATNAVDREEIKIGHVYVAPPGHHLLLEEGYIRVTQGPKENRFRPAVDPLFRSAAYIYGPRVIGVVLTGALNDGTAGLWTIKERGGVAVVQDPAEAMYPDMPFNALRHVQVDHRVPLSEVAPLLVQLTSEAVEEGEKAVSDELEIEINFAKQEHSDILDVKRLGEVSTFTCPECHGSLWQMREGGVLRFRCRTGHAYTVQALLADLSTSVETLLWNAIRGLEEKTDLVRHLANHLRQEGQAEASEIFLAQAQLIEQRTGFVRQALPKNGDKGEVKPTS